MTQTQRTGEKYSDSVGDAVRDTQRASQRMLDAEDGYVSSSVLCAARSAAASFMATIPADRRRKVALLRQECRTQIARIMIMQGMTAPAAAIVLAAKFQSWQESAEWRSEYCREVLTWLADGGWEEHKSAWTRRSTKAANARNKYANG